jgi:hypothetical protein
MKRSLNRVAKEFAFAVLTLSFCVIAVSGLNALKLLPAFSRFTTSQASNQQKAVKKVKDASELRPKEADDRKLADFFDREGPSVLENKLIVIPNDEDVPVAPTDPDSPPQEQDRLRAIVCDSDAIIVGQAVDTRTLLNRSETFLFTDFTVAVTNWIKPRGGPGTVNVAMLGGAVEVGNTLLKSTALPILELQKSALLFLKRIPGVSHAYGLTSRAVRLESGVVVNADLPKHPGKDLAQNASLPAVLALVTEKQGGCGGQK